MLFALVPLIFHFPIQHLHIFVQKQFSEKVFENMKNEYQSSRSRHEFRLR